MVSFTLVLPQKTQCLIHKNSSHLATSIENPIFYSILRYLGKAYLGYKVGQAFEYVENKLSSKAKSHVVKTWSAYDRYSGHDNSSSVGKSIKRSFDNHYSKCELCRGLGKILTKEDLETEVRQLENQIIRLNSITNSRIDKLESELFSEISIINSRLKDLENRTTKIEYNVENNSRNIENNSRRIQINTDDIAEYSKPRVLILTVNKDSENYKALYRAIYDKFEVRSNQIQLSKSPQVVIINRRMKSVGNRIAKAMKLYVVNYENTGLNGFEDYDILVFL